MTLILPHRRGLIRPPAVMAAPAVDYYANLQALSPAVLFAPGVSGSCFQETTGASATTPSTNGDVVGSLKNQGALGGWATAPTNSQRPILRVSGGLTYLEFDGVDDFLDFPTAVGLFNGVGNGFLAASHRFRTSPAASKIVGHWSSGSTTFSARASLNPGPTSGKYVAGGRRADGDSFQGATSSASVSTSTPVTHMAEFDWTNSDLFQYINNSLDGSNTSFQTNGSTDASNSQRVGIGGHGTGGYADVDIYGFVAKAAFMTRATVHAWLANVAGI